MPRQMGKLLGTRSWRWSRCLAKTTYCGTTVETVYFPMRQDAVSCWVIFKVRSRAAVYYELRPRRIGHESTLMSSPFDFMAAAFINISLWASFRPAARGLLILHSAAAASQSSSLHA